MTNRRRKLYEKAVEQGRIRHEHGKWYVLCRDCTGRKKENVYHVVSKRQQGRSIEEKGRTVEEKCMDALRGGVYTCSSKARERL